MGRSCFESVPVGCEAFWSVMLESEFSASPCENMVSRMMWIFEDGLCFVYTVTGVQIVYGGESCPNDPFAVLMTLCRVFQFLFMVQPTVRALLTSPR